MLKKLLNSRKYNKHYFCILLVFFLSSFLLEANESHLDPQKEDPKKIRVALVLGAGGARGLAHLGVLEEFEKAGIEIDLIVGCSSGSIVGALYSDNPNALFWKSLLINVKMEDFLDWDVWGLPYGLSKGIALRNSLKRCLRSENIEQLQIPFMAIATDLHLGQEVVFNEGPIIPAVHASSAFPLCYAPVEMLGSKFVDGGVMNPIPVSVARKYGAEIVIAVDLSQLLPSTYPTNLFGVGKRTWEIMFSEQSKNCVRDADFVITPDVGYVGTFTDQYNYEVYDAGKAAAKKVLPEIIEAYHKSLAK